MYMLHILLAIVCYQTSIIIIVSIIIAEAATIRSYNTPNINIYSYVGKHFIN